MFQNLSREKKKHSEELSSSFSYGGACHLHFGQSDNISRKIFYGSKVNRMTKRQFSEVLTFVIEIIYNYRVSGGGMFMKGNSQFAGHNTHVQWSL